MRRRDFIALLGSAAAASPFETHAQLAIPATARVGVLTGASISTPSGARFRKAFVEALRRHGWEEGRNLLIEVRASEGRPERYAQLAAELVASNVDVAVGSGSQGVQALKAATASIPIVMLDVSHPIEAGFISSLARPGGNITGVTPQLDETNAKALELLREIKPTIDRIGILYTPSNAGSVLALKQSLADLPQRLGLPLVAVPIDTPSGVEAAFEVIDREGLPAVQIHPTPIVQTNRQRISELFIERRIPTVTGFNTLVRDGILMSYGSDQEDSWRGAAFYVDRILRGAKPADLPVERPTKFLLTVNLKTARAIGVDIPPTLLARADEVIE
jgi:putative ABC transport system substrate-binding protein